MCTSFVAKLVLSLVNTLILMIGMAMFVIGILIKTQPALSRDALSVLLEKLKSSASSVGVTIDTSKFSVADVAYSFYIALICIGLFLAVVSMLGLVGVKYSLKPVLVVYFAITFILFLAQLVAVVIAGFDRSLFDDAVKPHLKNTITENFNDVDSDDPTSQIWSGIMIYEQCCGVDGVEDFNDAKKWDRFVKGQGPLETPLACCKTIPTGDPYDPMCAKSPTDVTNNRKTGCYNKIWDFVLSQSGIVIGIAVGVLCSQLLLLLLTCVLMNNTNKVGNIV